MRLPLLDGFRGLFVVAMVIGHCNEALGTVTARLNFNRIAFYTDAHSFVFVSGFVLAMVYGRSFDRGGLAACAGKTWRRIGVIWRYHAVLVAGMVAAALLLPAGVDPGPLAPFRAEPRAMTLASLGLGAAAMHMAILPMYMILMAPLPLVIAALARGQAPAVAALSAVLWGLGQTPVAALPFAALDAWLRGHGLVLPVGLYFNLFAWQLLFTGGAIAGFAMQRGRLPLAWLHTPAAGLAATAAALLLALTLLSRLVYADHSTLAWVAAFRPGNARTELPPLHLASFALMLFGVTWLTIAGPQARSAPVRWLAGQLRRLVGSRPLRTVGEHSLPLFALHIPLAYTLHLLVGPHRPSEALGVLILAGCLGLLLLAAAVRAGRLTAAAPRTA